MMGLGACELTAAGNHGTGQAVAMRSPLPAIHHLGPIEALRASCGTGSIQVFLDQTGCARERSYGFLLLVQGTGQLRHYGPETILRQGDFVLINSVAPYNFHLEAPGTFIMLRVAPRILRAYLPAPEYFCGRPLRANDGISEGTAELVQNIFTQLEAGLETEFRSRIARNLLDTLATAFSIGLDGAIDGSPVICSLYARVRLHIERNLRDPDLKPSAIAAKLRLSPRYLRVIFAASKETVSAYILRRRLEECARQLTNPQFAHLSITEIAFGCGFNSGPHFTRSFRDRFGASPRNYRRFSLDDLTLGSGLVDQSQKMTVAARAMAEKNT